VRCIVAYPAGGGTDIFVRFKYSITSRSANAGRVDDRFGPAEPTKWPPRRLHPRKRTRGPA